MNSVRLNLHRRFPDTIVRKREGPGSHDGYGEWVPGTVTETELSASVQRLDLEDSDTVGGARLVERLKVFVPVSSGDLQAAFDDAGADRVVWKGREYVVEESRTWPRFTHATLLRET